VVAELVVRGARKTYPARPHPVAALGGLDLTVPAGTIAAILGPSGCGKTTLLRAIAGFDVLDAGEISIRGRTVVGPGTYLPPERRSVGVVPQEGALFPHLSVAENIGFGLARRHRARRVDELLDLVGLPGHARRMPHELSGGEQQRIALARALAGEPDLVLLDEPFSALDAGLRITLREDVRETLRRAGTTAVLVTHDQEEALSVADLVAVMRKGVVVQAADPITLYREPVDLGVARFVGDSVLLTADFDGDHAQTALGRLPLIHRVDGRCGTVLVRPEQLALDATPAAGIGADVLGVTFFGHDALVRLRVSGTPGGPPVEVAARLHGQQVPRPGDGVAINVCGRVAGFADPLAATA
jgi:iron(III) transport system ATP-binding protein